jgi:DNA-binding MarR family transcriptional regulator
MEKDSVSFQLRTLGVHLKRAIDRSEAVKTFEDVTGMHRWVIKYLIEQQERPVFQKDIEALLSIRRSTATKMLQLMEKNGYIARQQVDADARLKKIVLTPKAWELHQVIMHEIELLEQQLRQGITDAEMQQFFAVMEKMKANIE